MRYYVSKYKSRRKFASRLKLNGRTRRKSKVTISFFRARLSGCMKISENHLQSALRIFTVLVSRSRRKFIVNILQKEAIALNLELRSVCYEKKYEEGIEIGHKASRLDNQRLRQCTLV